MTLKLARKLPYVVPTEFAGKPAIMVSLRFLGKLAEILELTGKLTAHVD